MGPSGVMVPPITDQSFHVRSLFHNVVEELAPTQQGSCLVYVADGQLVSLKLWPSCRSALFNCREHLEVKVA